jgi:hypothetical protein
MPIRMLIQGAYTFLCGNKRVEWKGRMRQLCVFVRSGIKVWLNLKAGVTCKNIFAAITIKMESINAFVSPNVVNTR